MALMLLYETAAGYALYKVEEWDRIGNDGSIEELVKNESLFSKMVNFVAFQPFKSSAEALENITAIAAGEATDLLVSFLQQNIPQPKKMILAVIEPGLGKSLSNKGFNMKFDSDCLELIRGCRLYESKNIAKFSDIVLDIERFQVGLAHSYARSKMKQDPSRYDKPIINIVATLESVEKNLNTFAMRVREWYGWHFPELNKIIEDHKTYSNVIQFIQFREKFDALEDYTPLLQFVSEDVANNIIKASAQSMGQEITEGDMLNILNITKTIIKLSDMRESLTAHLMNKMKFAAPNLTELLGDYLSGRLISHAGSLVNLAKCPASTIQILGAEKALFRALKTRSNTPKYGFLYQSSYIGKASIKNKGKAARYLANKCALAARLDCFSDNVSNVYGKAMKMQLNKQLEYVTSGGDKPEQNLNVMREAIANDETRKSNDQEVKTTGLLWF